LLKTPEVAADILTSVMRACPQLAVTCKIRLLDSTEATVELMRRLAATGVRAIAVHARQRHERPADRAHWDALRAVVEAGEAAVGRGGGGEREREVY
jgi:tRNA-dihydrouridine synthase 2